MKTHAIIVNYKTAEMSIACLASIENELARYDNLGVTLVDNGSCDESAERIAAAVREHAWGSWASLVALERNVGFAAGNNAAIRPLMAVGTLSDYVLLLNADTIVLPGAIQSLVEFVEKHPKVGIAGSRLENPDGTPQRSAFLFPNIWSELNDGVHLRLLEKLIPRSQIAQPVRDEPHKTDWVAGASFMIRREVLEQIGLLDEKYFMYYEEVDFCLRAQRAGWECWYVPQSRVVHLVGQASKINNPHMEPKRRPAYWFESRKRFFRKNYGLLTALAADLLFATGYVCYRLRRMMTFRPVREPPLFLWDFLRFGLFKRDAPPQARDNAESFAMTAPGKDILI